ncbi:hypothetical protein Patl1_25928 [Pistacia atlantica]|uniref:Uncharacterized protein n=1 Tax=Pistacia atlantica TaxID=434234 RepID=A0ACC1B400_9ROSI|nr:hypothetical protein Patl1_25928 [Pistacia atlantica]
MSWLINSMEPRIGKTYLYYKTIKDIWEGVQKMYSDVENTTQSFEIISTIHSIKQGSVTVKDYFNSLTELWQEMDLYYEIDWNYTDNSTKHNQRLEKECVFDFLKGLTLTLIKLGDAFLQLNLFLPLVMHLQKFRREESHKWVMLSNSRMNSVLKPLLLLHKVLEIKKQLPNSGVITIIDPIIHVTHVGNFMGSPLIGSHAVKEMDKKEMEIIVHVLHIPQLL